MQKMGARSVRPTQLAPIHSEQPVVHSLRRSGWLRRGGSPTAESVGQPSSFLALSSHGAKPSRLLGLNAFRRCIDRQDLEFVNFEWRPTGRRSIEAFSVVSLFSIVAVRMDRFDMDIETNVTLMGRQTFKLVCEQCGSLTVALPIEAQPDPCSILKCGRCGSPRGTLQSLRDTSIQAGIRHPV